MSKAGGLYPQAPRTTGLFFFLSSSLPSSSTLLHHQLPLIPEVNVIIATRACCRGEWVRSPPAVRQVPEETQSHCVRTGTAERSSAGGPPPPTAFAACHHPRHMHVRMCVSLRESAGEKAGEPPACRSRGWAGSGGRRIGTLKEEGIAPKDCPRAGVAGNAVCREEPGLPLAAPP